MRDRGLGRVRYAGGRSRAGEHGVAGPCFPEGLAPEGAAKSIIKSRAEPSRAEPSRAEPSRAEPSRAEPSRAEPSRAEPSRAPSSCPPGRILPRLSGSRSGRPPDPPSFAPRGAPPAPLPTGPPGTAPPPGRRAPAAGDRRLRRGRPGRSPSTGITPCRGGAACAWTRLRPGPCARALGRLRRAALRVRAPRPPGCRLPSHPRPAGRRRGGCRGAVAPAHAQHPAYIEVYSATLTVGARSGNRGYSLRRLR